MEEKDNTIPRFYVKAKQNNFRTAQEGKPCFDDKEYVEIIVPGITHSTVDREVQERDKERWPEQYRRFKEGQTPATEGTPLEEWAGVSAAQVADLKARNVRTVEQLAGVPDGALQNLGLGARVLRDKAQAWLAQAAGNAPLDKAMAEIADLRAQIAALKTPPVEIPDERTQKADAG